MRSPWLASASLLLVLASACSSSSSGSTGNDQNKGDAGTDTTDATPAPDTGTPETVSLDDTAVDDTPPSSDSNVGADTSSSNKCAGVVCTGAYMSCCPSTGTCYDTRYGTCY